MRRWVATCAAAVLLVSAVVHADLTVTQTITIEGAAAAFLGGNTAPRMVMRFKGNKARTETEMMGQTRVMLADLATKQTVTLDAVDKTARVMDAATPQATSATAPPGVEVSFKPTGQKRTIDNVVCDEYAIAMTISMSDMGRPGAEMSPEGASMLQGMKMVMTGSMWIAKSGAAAAEFAAFQKAAVEANMSAMLFAMGGGANGLDRITSAAASARGLPYLSEITMNIEGTGQMADMMKQMGSMKITTRVTAISTDALPDDLFTVPAGYTIVK